MKFATNILRNICIASIAAPSFAGSGCSDRLEEAADHAALAEAQFASGNLEAARENVQRAIIASDDVANYFILLGRIQLQSGELPSAFNAYSRALDLQADNLEVLQAIAELGLQTDRLQEAEEAADRMLLLSPGSTRAKLVKGFLAIEKNQLEEARELANAIVGANPNDEGGTILLARLQALDGNFDEAVQTVISAREAIGETNALNATLLEIYRAAGDTEGLRSVFPKVIDAAEQNLDYRLDFINFLYKTEDMQAARSQALEAIEIGSTDRPMLGKLSALFLEYDRSPLTSDELFAIARSGSRATRMTLARFYLDSDQLDKAQALMARDVAEGSTEAKALMARIALAAGRPARAEALVEEVLAVDPRDPDALLVRSARRLAKEKVDAAIEDANVVVSDAPQEYAGYAALAKAHLARGHGLRARQVFEQGVDFLPQSELLVRYYEATLRAMGDHARIVSLYGELAAAKPSSRKAWEEFSRVCEEFGDEICKAKIGQGMARARTSYLIDDPPGTPRARGLFSRITPEQICRSSGGVCTES